MEASVRSKWKIFPPLSLPMIRETTFFWEDTRLNFSRQDILSANSIQLAHTCHDSLAIPEIRDLCLKSSLAWILDSVLQLCLIPMQQPHPAMQHLYG